MFKGVRAGRANGNGKQDGSDGAVERSGAEKTPAARGRARKRRRDTATEHSELGEKLIAGVPARIMRPRLVFLSCLGALLAFGLLMVYSASAVEALKEQGSSTYFLMRQAIFMGVGLAVFAAICLRHVLPWELFRSGAVWVFWGVVLVLLLVVLAIGAGGETWGATRWIPLGFFNLQPSELAKPAIVLAAGRVMAEYYEDCSIDTPTFLITLCGCVIAPLLLIFLQPDLGTTIIIAAAVLAMAYLAGVSYRLMAMIGVMLLIAGVAAIAAAPYRLARYLVALDPWSDPYGDGYQATLAIMSFASGGLFGRGIGNSTMKYSYLPEAHNDYILAIIGEELGFVGTAAFFLVFLVMIGSAFTIARRSPSLHGQLLAGGCTFILAAQFFINVLGILGVTPMTGKPLPFISYGGSAILGAMILAGIICRVSLESNVQTAHDARRADFAVMSEQDVVSDHIGRSTAGAVRVRRGSGTAADASGGSVPRSGRSRSGFSVYDGGATANGTSDQGFADDDRRDRRGRASGAARTGSRGMRSDRPRGGYERINLSGGESDRLRTGGTRPRVDYGDVSSARVRRSGDGRGRERGANRGRPGSGSDQGYGRNRYDR